MTRKNKLIILLGILLLSAALMFGACGVQGEKGDTGADGVGIVSIEKLYSQGLTDVYEIKFSNGETTTFTVKNGQDGKDGETPYVGSNGNWWIGEKDTGEPVKGEVGADGVGIEKIETDGDGNWAILYTDGTTQTLRHVWEKIFTLRSASCTESGLNLYVCKDCALARVETTEKLPHDYVNTVVEPTCISGGYTLLTCENCGYEYKDNCKEPLADSHIFETETCVGCGKNIADVAVVSYDMSVAVDGSIRGYVVPRYDGFYDFYIFGSGKMWDYSGSTAPLYVDGYTSTVKNAFMSDGIENIGALLFFECELITGIKIPDSVTSIGESAFNSCYSLTNIDIPDSLTSIGVRAFNGCMSLKSIEIPDGVTSIGTQAFNACRALTSIDIPDSVISIGDYAFRFCDSLANVKIGNGVTSIGRGAFQDTAFYNNKENWENNLLYIDKCLIEGNVVGPYQIKADTRLIAEAAFADSLVTSLHIPDSVTSIGDYAFNGCKNLTSITIPDSVTSIGSYAFQYCSGLTGIYYGGTAEKWEEIANKNYIPYYVVLYYYSESKPTEDGNYWHYDTDGKTPVVWKKEN